MTKLPRTFKGMSTERALRQALFLLESWTFSDIPNVQDMIETTIGDMKALLTADFVEERHTNG